MYNLDASSAYDSRDEHVAVESEPLVMEIQLWRSKMRLGFAVQHCGATCCFGVC